jgi:hypothetical protein
MALIGERLFLAMKSLSQAMMGRDDEIIRLQLVLFLPAKYSMRRGTAEYEVDFNLNGRTHSETNFKASQTHELGIEREIRF